jgi:hypothetical protein
MQGEGFKWKVGEAEQKIFDTGTDIKGPNP